MATISLNISYSELIHSGNYVSYAKNFKYDGYLLNYVEYRHTTEEYIFKKQGNIQNYFHTS